MAECDHCGIAILWDERVVGRDGAYCSTTCRYDAEVMGVGPGDLPQRRGER